MKMKMEVGRWYRWESNPGVFFVNSPRHPTWGVNHMWLIEYEQDTWKVLGRDRWCRPEEPSDKLVDVTNLVPPEVHTDALLAMP